ncbi:MAG: EthD domain-containing protein [Sphingomonadales bacterium]|nr:EthD domain-containing protein [Sphingomonadales bacterium]
MYKIVWLLKRKPGTSHEQFREHYESSHAVLGQKYFGHLILSYKRNYDIAKQAGQEGAFMAPRQSDYDCVTEWVMPSEAAFEECMGLMADPAIGKLFLDDEEHFLDSSATRLVRCDTYDTGPGDGAETLKLKAVPK